MRLLRRNTQLILALDVHDTSKALSLINETVDYLDAVKIGYPLVLSAGIEIFNTIAEFAPVIADFKIADIPYTDRQICSRAFEAGASAVIVQGFTGKDTVIECVNTAKEYHGDIFVVVEMSHPGAVEFMQPQALELASLALYCNARGVVAPATRPERVRQIREVVGALTIISPGVGAQGGSAASAITAGADFVIVGRAIYESSSPRIEAERIAEEIEQCR